MDRSIPLGGRFSIGLDGILGLIPGVGDAVGGLIGSIVIVQAWRAGLPRATVLRMIANVGIDAVLGAVPLLGDLFDFAFKATSKNVALYRQSMAGAGDPRGDLGFVVAILLAVVSIVALPVLLLIWIVERLF